MVVGAGQLHCPEVIVIVVVVFQLVPKKIVSKKTMKQESKKHLAMAQETLNNVLWAFFSFALPLALFPPHLQSSHHFVVSCSPVVPFGLVAVLLLSCCFEVAPIPTPQAGACGGGHHHGLSLLFVVCHSIPAHKCTNMCKHVNDE